MQAAMQCRRI